MPSTHCGTGAGGTRNISGTNHDHVLLEAELADLHGKEAALLFTSGYVSNWAALVDAGHRACPMRVILSDALNHASMIEGIRHSRAQQGASGSTTISKIWTRKLAALPPMRPRSSPSRSVYSMDGDICPMKEICRRGRKARRDDLSR